MITEYGKDLPQLGVFDDASLQSSLSLRGKKGNSFCNFLINILVIYFSFSLYIMLAALCFCLRHEKCS